MHPVAARRNRHLIGAGVELHLAGRLVAGHPQPARHAVPERQRRRAGRRGRSRSAVARHLEDGDVRGRHVGDERDPRRWDEVPGVKQWGDLRREVPVEPHDNVEVVGERRRRTRRLPSVGTVDGVTRHVARRPRRVRRVRAVLRDPPLPVFHHGVEGLGDHPRRVPGQRQVRLVRDREHRARDARQGPGARPEVDGADLRREGVGERVARHVVDASVERPAARDEHGGLGDAPRRVDR